MNPLRAILFVSVYIIPIVSLYEIVGMFLGVGEIVEVRTPAYIKVLKDLVFAFSIAFFFFSGKPEKRVRSLVITLCVPIFILPSIIYSFASGLKNWDPILIVVALRMSEFPLLIIFAAGSVRLGDLDFLRRHINIIFILHFIIQLIQWRFNFGYYSESGFLGGSGRNPGLFLIPAGGAALTALVLLLNVIHVSPGENIKKPILYSTLLSILLTGSGLGLILYCFIVSVHISFRWRQLALIAVPVILPCGAFLFSTIMTTIRGDSYLTVSGGDRVSILFDQLMAAPVFSPYIGLASSTGAQFFPDSYIVSDSTWASLAGNFGTFSMILVFISLYILMLSAFNSKKGFLVLGVFVLASCSILTLEFYPANYIFAILFAHLFTRQKAPEKSLPNQCEKKVYV